MPTWLIYMTIGVGATLVGTMFGWLRRSPATVDVESFKGKLALLVIDKLILGAVIGATIVCYDQWRTADVRRYDEHVELPLKRAEYVKSLIPIVADDTKDVLVRAEALDSLIRTRSIDDLSSLMLTERLLAAGLIRAEQPSFLEDGGRRAYLMWDGRHFLLTSLLDRMPDALPALLDQFMTNRAATAFADRAPSPRLDTLADGHFFWRALFGATIRNCSDAQLRILNDPRFVDEHLTALLAIDPLTDPPSGRNLLGLRIAEDIHVLASARVNRSQSAYSTAVSHLVTLIVPPVLSIDNLRLSADVLRELPASDLSIAEASITIIAEQERDLRNVAVDPPMFNPVLGRAWAAGD